jgi:hypothetical protein
MSETDSPEEIITDESVGGARTIRVYDPAKGDFPIEVPEGAKVTFGYFNPAAPRDMVGHNDRGYGPGPDNVARQTALRIYEHGEKSNQLACFIGVKGFRDTSIKLTRLSQKVVIETTEANDESEGIFEWSGKRQRQIVAAPEEGSYQ